MQILLAFDKFKGSLSARDASDAVCRGLKRGGFDTKFTQAVAKD